MSSAFTTSGGVFQSCLLSLFSFNFIIDLPMDITLSPTEFLSIGLLPRDKLMDLEYADYIILFSEDNDPYTLLFMFCSDS